MAKSIISLALEELDSEVVEEPIQDLETIQEHSDTSAEFERAVSTISENSDRIEEAEGLGDVLSVTADQLDAAASADQEPTEELVIAAESMVVYACKRIGVGVPTKIAVEDFKGVKDKREKLKQAAKEIRDLNTKLASGIEIAQEGLASDVRAFFETAFKSTDNLRSRLKAAMAASDASDGDASGEISAEWVEQLCVHGTANADAVIKAVHTYEKLFSDAGLPSTFKKIEQVIKKATKSVRGIWFWSNSNDIDRLKELMEQMDEEVSKVTHDTVASSYGSKTAKVLTTQEASKLGKAAMELLNTDELEKSLTEVGSAETSNMLWSVFNGHTFRVWNGFLLLLSGPLSPITNLVQLFSTASKSDSELMNKIRHALTAEDIAKARKISSKGVQVRGKIVTSIKNRNYLINAITKYITESAKARGTK